MDPVPASKVVKLGDILPALASFESVLGSLKSYKLWPVVLREALLDKAISGVSCTAEEADAAWVAWCGRHDVDPLAPVFEGLSTSEMRLAASRDLRVEKFKDQAFTRFLPEYFRSRKADLDRVALEIVQFHHAAIAEEALFRCREGEQSLEEAAHELAHRDGGEPPIKRVGPIAVRRLSAGLMSLVAGSRSGALLGPKKIGQFHVIVRVLEVQEASLDARTRQRLLDELLNQWIEQQMSAMTGRAPRQVIQEG
jgi:hypothetical protein